MVEVAIGGHRQRTGDRGGCHHDDIDAFTLLAQQHALAHAEPVLLVDHGEAKVLVGHALGYQGVGADDDFRAAVPDRLKHCLASATAPLAKQEMRFHPHRGEKGVDAGVMLAGEDLCRGKKGRLGAGLHRMQHCRQRHQCLAGTDITLKHAQHPARGLLVGPDFGDRAGLRAGRLEGKRGHQRFGQRSGSGKDAARHVIGRLVSDKRQRQLVRQQFVKGEAASRFRRRHQIIRILRGVHLVHGCCEVRPAT